MPQPLHSRFTLSVFCLGSRIANAHNSSISNKFANDGSFLQQFLKLQKAQTSTGECCFPILSPPTQAPIQAAHSHPLGSLASQKWQVQLQTCSYHPQSSLSASFHSFPTKPPGGECRPCAQGAYPGEQDNPGFSPGARRPGLSRCRAVGPRLWSEWQLKCEQWGPPFIDGELPGP